MRNSLGKIQEPAIMKHSVSRQGGNCLETGNAEDEDISPSWKARESEEDQKMTEKILTRDRQAKINLLK